MITLAETLTEPLSALRPSRYMLIRMDDDVKMDCGLTLDDVRIGEIEPQATEREPESEYLIEQLALLYERRRRQDDEFGLWGFE